LAVLLGICLFAFPARATDATDTVTVTVTIPELFEFSATGDFTATLDGDDLDAGYYFAGDVTTIVVKNNDGSWTLKGKLSAVPSTYSVWIDDAASDPGDDDTTGFKQLTAVDAALDNFANYGTAGDWSYSADWMLSGLDWEDNEADDLSATATFTLTY
jgi:hypothetical protein